MVGQAKTSGFVNVGTGSTPVVAGNPNRGRIILTNDGANVIYLMYGLAADGTAPTAVAGSGARLNANGGSIVEDSYTGPIAAIAMTAATNLCVLET
jgi:hypothetical protein